MLCWVNGVFVDVEQIKEHIRLDEITYTEVFRTYEGSAVFLASYYMQLCERLKDYETIMPYSITEIREVIARLNAQGSEDGAFSIHVIAKPHQLPFLERELEVVVLIMRRPVEPIGFYREKQAIWLQVPYRRDALQTFLHVCPKQMDDRSMEGFLVTENGEVATSITSIIFWAKDDILYTPSLQVGIYPTVSRQLVIEVAKKMGYHVREDIYLPYEVEEAHECFIVNPIDEIIPIQRLGQATFAGQDGLLYERLYYAYGYEILRELRRG